MAEQNHWTSPRPNGTWAHKAEGSKRASGVYETQAEAWKAAQEAARAAGSEAILQSRNGQIREKNTYGPDNHPPKG